MLHPHIAAAAVQVIVRVRAGEHRRHRGARLVGRQRRRQDITELLAAGQRIRLRPATRPAPAGRLGGTLALRRRPLIAHRGGQLGHHLLQRRQLPAPEQSAATFVALLVVLLWRRHVVQIAVAVARHQHVAQFGADDLRHRAAQPQTCHDGHFGGNADQVQLPDA